MKKIKHITKIIILGFIGLHLLGLTGVILYYKNTGFISEITITANNNNQFSIKTPLNNEIHISNNTDEILIIHKRPIKSIYLINAENNHKKIDLLQDNKTKQTSGVNFKKEKSIWGLCQFVNALNLHFIWLSFLGLFVVLMYFVNQKEIKKAYQKHKYRYFKKIINKSASKHYVKLLNESGGNPKQNLILKIGLTLYCASLFFGVGSYNIQQDESGKWRALVALEMKYSDNYITPTLNGEYYYNKPPLFNYFLVPFVDSEEMLEFKLRSVNLIFILALIFLSFLIAKAQLPQRYALISSFIFAFSPLIIFVQSLRISIDPFFAVLLVSLFYGNYHWFKKSKTLNLFIFGYFITAIAFLTKAYPAIYFQFISLISLAFVFKKVKLLFSWKHLLGITVFAAVIGTYVLLYQSINNDSFWLFELFSDVNYKLDIGLQNKTENLLTFWGKSIIAYPILFLFPLLFLKKIRYHLIRNKFDFYSILLFVGGCLPFLTGDYYPQYILMLIPFITIPLIRYHTLIFNFTLTQKFFLIVLSGGFLLLATLINQANLFVYGCLSIILFILFSGFIIFKRGTYYTVLSSMMLFLIIRQIFIFTPIIKDKDEYANIKADAKRIKEKTGNDQVHLYPNNQSVNYASMFYLTYHNQAIIPIDSILKNQNHHYLSTKNHIPNSAVILDSISQKASYQHPNPYGEYTFNNVLYLFRLNNETN